jgi:hypothetical protein
MCVSGSTSIRSRGRAPPRAPHGRRRPRACRTPPGPTDSSSPLRCTGQVAEFLATHGIQGAGRRRPCGADGAPGRSPGRRTRRAPTCPVPARPPSADDPDVGVQEKVEGDPLLGASDHAGRRRPGRRAPGAPALSGSDATQRRRRGASARTSPVWHGSSAAPRCLEAALVIEVVHLLDADVEIGDAGPARLSTASSARYSSASRPHRRGFDPQGQVLGDDRDDVIPLVGEVARHGQDAGVVVAETEPGRQRRSIGVVELDTHACRPELADRHRVRPADLRRIRSSSRMPQGRGGRSSPARGGGAWPPVR